MAKKKRDMPKALKIPLIIIITFSMVIVGIIGGLSLLKFGIYSSFYQTKKNIFAVPGLNNGGVPQGICINEDNNTYYVSEYDKNHEQPSRIYTIKGDESRKYSLYKDGKPFVGHVGGIATDNNYLYLADGGRIYIVNLDLFSIDNVEAKINLTSYKEVPVAASFVFTNGNELFVGEFHYDKVKAYTLTHDVTRGNTTHHALVAQYHLSDFDPNADTPIKPHTYISITDKVQGFAYTDDNKFVLSTSWGVSSSHAYVYENPGVDGTYQDEGGETYPLIFLDNPIKDIVAPPMFEDLDYSEGRIITLTESACDKYIFGKPFGAYYAFSFKI